MVRLVGNIMSCFMYVVTSWNGHWVKRLNSMRWSLQYTIHAAAAIEIT